MSNRSESTGARHATPTDIQPFTDKFLQDAEALRTFLLNHVEGCECETPTTGSTQATGATGVTDWNVNLRAGVVIVGGVALNVADDADYDVHSGSIVTGLQSTYTVVAALVAKNVSGTVSLQVVLGTAALTAGGTAVGPTDAVIQAAVGAANSWVKIAELTINRTADTTVTQSQDNSARPMLGVGEDTGIGDWSAFAE